MLRSNLIIPLLILIYGLLAIKASDVSWNVDPNRLQVLRNRRTLPNGRRGHSQRITSDIDNNEWITNQNHLHNHRTRQTYDDPYSPYSHYEPVVVKAPYQRKIYKSKENPADFYKTRRFLNRTKDADYPIQNNINKNNGYNRFYGINTPEVEEKPDGLTVRFKITPKNHRKKVHYEHKYDNMHGRRYNNHYSGSNFDNRPEEHRQVCIRCPAERTLIVSKGRERVLLEAPHLVGCDQNPIPPGSYFKPLYGPKIGTLLKEGSHITVGSIIVNNETLHLCQYRNNVIVRRCPELRLGPDITATCPRGGAWGSICRFKCSGPGPSPEMIGPARIKCEDNLTWSSTPPTCKAQTQSSDTWCEMPMIPEFSRINCDTKTGGDAPSGRFPEGSLCQITCRNQHTSADVTIDPKQPLFICKGGLWHGDKPYCPKPRYKRHKRGHLHNM